MSQRPISPHHKPSHLAMLHKGDPVNIKLANENGEVKIIDFHMQHSHRAVRLRSLSTNVKPDCLSKSQHWSRLRHEVSDGPLALPVPAHFRGRRLAGLGAWAPFTSPAPLVHHACCPGATGAYQRHGHDQATLPERRIVSVCARYALSLSIAACVLRQQFHSSIRRASA